MSNKKPTHQGIVFQSPRGKKEWYWHIKAIRGGKIIATSGEGFGSSGVAKRALNNAIKVIADGNVETIVEPSLAQKKAAKEKAAKARAKKTTARKATKAKRKTTKAKAKKTTARKATKAKRSPKSKVAPKTKAKAPAKRAKKMSVVEGGATEKAA